MNQDVLNQIIKTTIEWLTLPQTWALIGYLAIKLPSIIEAFKKAKKDEYIKITKQMAVEVCSDLVNTNLSNDEKRIEAISILYKILPNSKKYISETTMTEIINSAYHTYVKYKVESKNVKE